MFFTAFFSNMPISFSHVPHAVELGVASWLFVAACAVRTYTCPSPPVRLLSLRICVTTVSVFSPVPRVRLLVMKGTEAIEKALSFWSYVLYAVYLLFMIVVFVKFSGNIGAEFAKAEVTGNWFLNGLQYSFYNLGIVPALLYTVRDWS